MRGRETEGKRHTDRDRDDPVPCRDAQQKCSAKGEEARQAHGLQHALWPIGIELSKLDWQSVGNQENQANCERGLQRYRRQDCENRVTIAPRAAGSDGMSARRPG